MADVKTQPAPNVVALRLSLYLRQLEQLLAEGIRKVSSQQLAASLQTTAAQVRKDLTHFGQFGRPGMGYEVAPLIEELRRILGTDRTWSVIVVGVGDLGSALLRYRGFRKKGFEVVAAFDVSAGRVGKTVGSVAVYHVDQIPAIVRKHNVRLAILTAPAEAAQELTDLLCRAGVKGILNFAPTTLRTSPGVAVQPVDLAAQLEQLSFRIASVGLPRR